MKATERHKLKENEFAKQRGAGRRRRRAARGDITRIVVALIALLVDVGGYSWWRSARRPARTRRWPPRWPSTRCRSSPCRPGAPAARRRCRSRARSRPSRRSSTRRCRSSSTRPTRIRTPTAGIAARFHAAAILAAQGKPADAEQRYKEVVDKAGNTIYRANARLGMAEAQVAQGKFDSAIAIYSELSRDPNSTLPLDSVLMHLGRAYARAGKKEEAIRSFTRVVDEFPQSAYAADARREIEETKKQS